MDTIKSTAGSTSTTGSPRNNGPRSSHVGEAAGDLLNEGKKFANEIYEEGLNKVSEVEDDVKEYSDRLLRKVQENPLTSVLVAGGVGFVLSLLFKK